MEEFTELASDSHYFIGFNAPNHALLMKFLGDMSDDEYKEIWHVSYKHAYEKGIENFVIDQSEIGLVSFGARAWVMVKMYPKIKRDLSPQLKGAIITSSNIVHRSGVQYLVKAFQRVSGYKIEFQDNYELALKWFKGFQSSATLRRTNEQ